MTDVIQRVDVHDIDALKLTSPISPSDSGVCSTKCTPTADSILQDEDIQLNTSLVQAQETELLSDMDIDLELKEIMANLATTGPDELVDADSIISFNRNKAVKIDLGGANGESSKLVPISVPTLLLNASRKFPEETAMAVKREGAWRKWSYVQYYTEVREVARAFIHLGLQPMHGVCIMGFNSPEWFISGIASIFAGGLLTGIYTTNTADSTAYVCTMSKANIAVVENDQQMQKMRSVWESLPHLKAIIQYDNKLKQKYDNCYNWNELGDISLLVHEDELNARLRGIAINKCGSLIFTSGTTGSPKGVMLSHDNITWTSEMAARSADLRKGDRTISYLPLSHIAAQIVDIYIPLHRGCSVYFAQPDALKGSLKTTMCDVRPTHFLGVPRVWEKFEEAMKQIGRQSSFLKRKVALWAKDIGYRGNMALQRGDSVPFGWTLANTLVFKKVKFSLGLDQCRMFMTSAAPISKETLDFFLALDIPICEIYGMSECTGPHSVSMPEKYKTTSVGIDMTGVRTVLDNSDNDGNGEICMNGRHVFMGYLDMEKQTKDTIDERGLLHTGDVGRKDSEGFLFITGRIKELIITAGGENVAPILIEDAVKFELPCISQAMLIGDKKKFLSILLTLKTVVDPDSMIPQDNLTPASIAWCRSIGSKATKLSEILRGHDGAALRGLQAGIDRANVQAVSRAQKIQKWSILPIDFSIPGGELGPTMKLKRPIVADKYKKTIDAFYE